jgi:LysM repeat protein
MEVSALGKTETFVRIFPNKVRN